MAFLKSLSKKVADYKDERAEIKKAQEKAFKEEKEKVKAEQHEAKLKAAEERGKAKAHKKLPGPSVNPQTKKKAKKVVKKIGSKLMSAAEKVGDASDKAQKGEYKVPDMYPKKSGQPPSLNEIWGINTGKKK